MKINFFFIDFLFVCIQRTTMQQCISHLGSIIGFYLRLDNAVIAEKIAKYIMILSDISGRCNRYCTADGVIWMLAVWCGHRICRYNAVHQFQEVARQLRRNCR